MIRFLCLVASIMFFLASVRVSSAACPAFSTLTNGTTADANVVMDNFNHILECPNFTGNVGVGTATPGTPLDVIGGGIQLYAGKTLGTTTSGASGTGTLRSLAETPSRVGTGDPASGFGLIHGANVESPIVWMYSYTGLNAFQVRSVPYNGTVATSTVLFNVDAGGKIGIGTTSADAPLSFPSTTGQKVHLYGGQPGGYVLGVEGNELRIAGGTGSGDFIAFKTQGYDGTERMRITGVGRVGIGTTAPTQALEVNGAVKIDTFASAASTFVCQNAGVLSSCSSSIRYKTDVKDATFGLGDVMRMRPVTFKWKDRDEVDFGLVAEDVAKINPLFVTYKNGQIEGIKYAQLTAIFVGAIKELKVENDELRAANLKHEAEIASLKAEQKVIYDRLNRIAAEARSRSIENH